MIDRNLANGIIAAMTAVWLVNTLFGWFSLHGFQPNLQNYLPGLITATFLIRRKVDK